MNILAEIRQRFVSVLDEYTDNSEELLDLIRPSSNPQFGDYQANLAMPLGSKLKRPPREIAAEVVDRLSIDDLCEPPEVAGPGFINLTLKNEWIASQLSTAFSSDRLGIEPAKNPKTIVIDFSSPNVAKPMHIGHIRSTVIGDSLARTLRFLGHSVITDNHLGDWGTQFGMIIYGYKNFVCQNDYDENPIRELGRLYKLVRQLMDYHSGKAGLDQQIETKAQLQSQIESIDQEIESLEKSEKKKKRKLRNSAQDKLSDLVKQIEKTQTLIATIEGSTELSSAASQHKEIGKAVLEETAKLHAGDEENLKLWHQFLPVCLADLHRIYDKLGVTFDEELGESAYHDQLESVVAEFQDKGLAKLSDGAVCIFLDDFDAPMLIQKQDGAFLYATSDLATIRFRVQKWNPDEVLYVVDHRQHEHFDKLFAVARLWGFNDIKLKHVEFGTVLGEDGRPIKTREGDIVGLEGVIDEAISRARIVVNKSAQEPGVEIEQAEQDSIARIVGMGALKYADLSQNRSSDYKFSYDKMLALKGDTGPYLQYSYARTQGIFRKGEIDVSALRTNEAPFSIDDSIERELALALLQFEEALAEVIVEYRPNFLSNYVYRLAKTFFGFFENKQVLHAENETLKLSRLKLCDLTARTVKQSLALMGMEISERM